MKGVTGALVSACSRSAGAVFRINDAKDYPDLLGPTIRRETLNVAACSLTTYIASEALRTNLAKSVIPKMIRKNLIVKGLVTLGPAILSEIWSRRFTGFDMTKLIAKEVAKARAEDKLAQTDYKPSMISQILSRAKFGEGYPNYSYSPGFQARVPERLAAASTATPFRQGSTAALRFNGSQSSYIA